jgi:hypothetical protein
MISVPLRQRDEDMPEDQIPKGLIERLARLDSKLDQLLAQQTASDEERISERLNLVEAQCRAEMGFTAWDDFDIHGDGGPAGALEDPLPFKPQVSAREVDSIFQKVDKINRDAEVMVRVEKLEKQNRKIVILGAMFMTLVLLLAGASAFLMVQARFLNQGGVIEARQAVEAPGSPRGEGVAKAHDPQGPQSPAGRQTTPVTKAPDPKPVAAPVDPTPAKAAPAFKYVGSKTSNKYHYPGCKWAAEIKPQNLIHFSSTAEAHKRGYIPCPTCHPPESDQEKAGH